MSITIPYKSTPKSIEAVVAWIPASKLSLQAPSSDLAYLVWGFFQLKGEGDSDKLLLVLMKHFKSHGNMMILFIINLSSDGFVPDPSQAPGESWLAFQEEAEKD